LAEAAAGVRLSRASSGGDVQAGSPSCQRVTVAVLHDRLGRQRPDDWRLFWPVLAFALVLGAILASLAASAVVWSAAVLIPLVLLLPFALRSVARKRRSRRSLRMPDYDKSP
jgi:uncharacterized membrane protein YfcA